MGPKLWRPAVAEWYACVSRLGPYSNPGPADLSTMLRGHQRCEWLLFKGFDMVSLLHCLRSLRERNVCVPNCSTSRSLQPVCITNGQRFVKRAQTQAWHTPRCACLLFALIALKRLVSDWTLMATRMATLRYHLMSTCLYLKRIMFDELGAC